MKKVTLSLSIIFMTVFLSACDSAQKKQFIRGCSSDGLVPKSTCSCTYDKLNDEATKIYGKDWGENPSIMHDEKFFLAMQKAALKCE